MKYTLSVLVENQPGVCAQSFWLILRRGFNIDSLAVGVTEDPAISRITIVVDGDEHIVEQVEKQLNKLIAVIKGKELNHIRKLCQLFVNAGKSNLQHKAAFGSDENC